MGLDWMLNGHVPKTGHEEQYHRIKNKLDRLDLDNQVAENQRKLLRRNLEAALEQETQSPFEVIGAPRVGIDEQATEWFRVNAYQPAQARVAIERAKPSARDPNNPQWGDRNEAFLGHWDRPFEALVQAEHGK